MVVQADQVVQMGLEVPVDLVAQEVLVDVQVALVVMED